MTRQFIDPKCIIQTLERLCARIDERFPRSGLAGVARDFLSVARDAAHQREDLHRPRIWIRISIGLILLVTAVVLMRAVAAIRLTEALFNAENFLQSTEASISTVVFLGVAVAFLLRLESGYRGGVALRLLYELRSLAHVVDMHQLTKDPETLLVKGPPTASSPPRTLTPFELSRYFDYCTELLSLISKVAAFYAQDLRNRDVLGAVDQIEDLTSSLSQKIWQKSARLSSLPR